MFLQASVILSMGGGVHGRGHALLGGMCGRGNSWWGAFMARWGCMAECILVSSEISSPAVLALPPCRTTKHLKYGCALQINVGS